jgi:LCP family protein required for cell wall assembly
MKKPKRKSGVSSFMSGFGYFLFLVLVLGAGTVFGWASRSKLLSRVLTNPVAFLDNDPKQTFHQNSLNLLILGCDEDRYYHGTYANGQNIYRKYARSDMMLVTKLDFANNQITGLSIPRDTLCMLPGHGRHKINAFHEDAQVFHWGDPDEITKQAVEHLLPSLHIDRVVVLDFEAIEKLVDLVGGVDLMVPKAMNYDDNAGELHIHIKQGFQRLDGYNAMCFVRFRHDAESDFGRQQRQKDFLLAFKKAVFQNIMRLPEVTSDGKTALNNALNDDEILSLAAFARRVPPDRIRMGMVPVVDGPGTSLLVNRKKLPATLAEFGFAAPDTTNITAN